MERQRRQSAIAATNALWRNERGHDNYFETSVVEDDICHDESEEDCDEIESNSEDESEGESESEDDTAPNVQNVMDVNEPTEADLLGKDEEVWMLEPPQITGRVGAHNIIGKPGPTPECKKK